MTFKIERGHAAPFHGSAGSEMSVLPPGTDNEVEFSIEVEAHGGDFVDAYCYLGPEERARLIRFLIEHTPGWETQ